MAMDRSKIVQKAYERIENSVNRSFEKQYNGTAKYDSSNYNRYAFKDEAELQSFMNYMSDNGVDVKQASRKFDGSFVVEIPKSTYRADVQDTAYLDKANKSSSGESVDTASLVNHYCQREDVNVYGFTPEQRDASNISTRTEDFQARQADRFAENHTIGQLEGVRELLSAAHSVTDTYRMVTQSFDAFVQGTKEDFKDLFIKEPSDANNAAIQNDKIFNGELHNENYQSEATVRVVGIKADGQPDYAVYMNGRKLEEGSDAYNNIIQMYTDRMTKAEDIVNSPKKSSVNKDYGKDPEVSMFKEGTREANAAEIMEHSYEQKFELAGQQKWYDVAEVNTLIQAMNMENLIQNENTHKSYSAEEGLNGFTASEKKAISDLEKSGLLSSNGSDVLTSGVASGNDFSMSITDREEALEELRSASNSLFTLNADEAAKLNSFMNGVTTGAGLSDAIMDRNLDAEWSKVSNSLKRYANNLSVSEKKAVDEFLDSGLALKKNLAEYEKINAQLKDPNLDLAAQAKLEAKQKQLETEKDKLIKAIDNSDGKKILQDAANSSSTNRAAKNEIENVIRKLDFSNFENSLREGNLHLLNDFKMMDEQLAKVLGLSRLNFADGITPQKLAELNKRFVDRAALMGLNVFTISGKLDVSALKALTPSQMRDLGLTKTTIDAIVMFNDKRAFNKPKGYENKLQRKLHKYQMRVAKAWQNISQNARGLVNKIVGTDEDIGQLLNNLYKVKQVVTFQHVKMVSAKITKIKHFINPKATTYKVNETLSAKIGNAAKNKLRSSSKYQEAARKKAQKVAEKQVKRAGKFAKKTTSKAAKKASGKVAAKAGKSAAKAVASKGLGKVAATAAADAGGGSVLAVIGAAVAVLAGAIIIIIILMVIIQSFVNRDPIMDGLAPKTAADTVAFKLYEQLKGQETAWASGLRNFDEIYEHRVDLRYTNQYLDWVDYSLSVDEFVLNYDLDMESHDIAKDDKTYVNPFHSLVFTNDGEYLEEDYRTEVTAFDGANKATIGTNECVYNMTSKGDKTSGNGYSIGLNTGHTSNIKDIIAMTDVMYSMEMDSMSTEDGGLGEGDAGIMGCSPEQLDWENMKDEKLGGVRIALSKFAVWIAEHFGVEKETAEDWFPLARYNKVQLDFGARSYATVLEYATTLFHVTHQDQYYLNVEYFNGDNQIHKDWDVKGNKVKQSEASKLGICVNPTYHKFYFAYDTNDGSSIRPCIKGNLAVTEGDDAYTIGGDGGGFYPVDGSATTYDLDVELNDERNFYNRNDLYENIADIVDDKVPEKCIKESSGSNKDTYNYILSQKDGNGCWYQDGDTINSYWDGYGQEYYETPTQEYGKDLIKINIRSERGYSEKDMHTEADAKDYIGNVLLWGSEFWHTTANMNWSGLYVYDSSYCPKDLGYFEDYLTTALNNQGFKYDTDEKLWIKYELNDNKNTFTITKVDTLPNAINNNYIAKDGKTIIDDLDNYLSDWVVDKKTSSSGVYRKYNLTKMTKTTYKRACKGHTYVYCGGHIAVHTHGSVYSATNDQIAMAGIVEDDVNPAADEFDVYDKFEELKGKYNEDNFPIDDFNDTWEGYSGDDAKMKAANVLAQKGGCESVFKDIYQGSEIGKQGLNLFIDDSGEWAEGTDITAFYTESDGVVKPSKLSNQMRDIFDADCVIKYGKNIFPTFADPSNYQSWTASNMQLALNRMSFEWADAYGFDIPWEIGDWNKPMNNGTDDEPDYAEDDEGHLIKGNSGARGYTLSADDIETIIDGVEEVYTIDEDREKSIRLALKWVGRGYDEGREVDTASPLHLPHATANFNQKTVKSANVNNDSGTKTVSFEGSSTMSYSFDFVDYIRYCAGETIAHPGRCEFGAGRQLYSFDSLRPGDYMIHRAGSTKTNFLKSDGTVNIPSNATGQDLDDYSMKQSLMLKDYYQEDQACVYIGKLNKNITLSTGQVLHSGVRLFVDMNAQMDYINETEKKIEDRPKDALGDTYNNGLVGQISLHGTKPTEFWKHWDYKYTYWWTEYMVSCGCQTELYRFK